MNAKERIKTIKLIELMNKNPNHAYKLGLSNKSMCRNEGKIMYKKETQLTSIKSS